MIFQLETGDYDGGQHFIFEGDASEQRWIVVCREAVVEAVHDQLSHGQKLHDGSRYKGQISWHSAVEHAAASIAAKGEFRRVQPVSVGFFGGAIRDAKDNDHGDFPDGVLPNDLFQQVVAANDKRWNEMMESNRKRAADLKAGKP